MRNGPRINWILGKKPSVNGRSWTKELGGKPEHGWLLLLQRSRSLRLTKLLQSAAVARYKSQLVAGLQLQT